MSFYFYPVVAPMAYFAVKFLTNDNGKIRIDKFFYVVYGLVVFLGFVVGIAAHFQYHDTFVAQKDAGEFLAGKENVLIVGDYLPGVPMYKMLEERRQNGSWLDYGLVWISYEKDEIEERKKFIENYWVKGDTITDGNFHDMFFVGNVAYRKDTNLIDFGYVCLTGNKTIHIPVDGELVFENDYVVVYETN
jgi:hypothetical protein